jgi:hypothetical protein
VAGTRAALLRCYLARIVEDAAFIVSMSVGSVSDADAESQGMTATGVRLPSPEADA